jgi:hypothetical protein
MTTRITGTKSITPNGDQTIAAPGGNINLITTSTGQIFNNSEANVGNPSNIPYDPTNIYGNAAERQSGSAYFTGGVGIEKDLNVGGIIYGRAIITATSSAIFVKNTNTDNLFFPTFANQLDASASLYGDSLGLAYDPATQQLIVSNISVTSSAATVSPVTGAFTVTGGAGFASDVQIGGSAFVDQIYTKIISSLSGPVSIKPSNGLTDLFSDIRVRGTNPIGTSPVVTNILYVTMDGDDTNDGRAMDASRACRTISGAINSPYYQSGTQIRVAPGHYLENNPIQLAPYTSITGADLRTTSIEPINKTQDLFHMNSGCYLESMQFLNGRSGLLPGYYAPGYNRGAYATAFPPLTGSDRLDIFHSPYIQNCTNLTGPWLVDGTMFVPDQTIQVPTAIGTGTWVANTTSIVVNISSGTISLGQSINPGQQNLGFFNARTLMLANKPFLQSQVVSYIQSQILANVSNTASIWYGFSTNLELSYRDVAILIENISYDAAFGGNEKAIESGSAYWNGPVSYIATSIPQCIAAINYLNSLTQKVIINTVCTVLPPVANIPSSSQVINTVLVGGGIASSSFSSLFSIVTNIIQNGPTVAPQSYISTGPDAAYVSAEILMQANRKFIQEQTINYINWSLVQPQPFGYLPYNKIKCARDTGIIIDSIAADLLYPTATYSQTTFAGLQYYNQNGYISNPLAAEITTTTAAVNYLKQMAIKVIKNVTAVNDAVVGIQRYSNASQNTSVQPATASEVAILENEFGIITSILSGNTTGWTDKVIANSTASNLLSVQDAYNSLINNVGYLQSEVTAYITATNGLHFTEFNTSTCIRDIGYMIRSVAFDLLHGGNRQAIQSGLSYYTTVGGNILIPAETTQTVAAFVFLENAIQTLITGGDYTPLQTTVPLINNLSTATSTEASTIATIVTTLTNIISQGPVGYGFTPIVLTQSTNTNVINAYNIIESNRAFLVAETLAWIDQNYNAGAFSYNQDLCYRDTGLLVDAVSQDILLGGNQRSVEAGLSYWNQAYNYVAGQISTTTAAISYIRDISLQIIANTTVTSITGTISTQIINPFFQYGGNYMPQQAVIRNFNIIGDIISNGPGSAPAVYAGGGLFALTGINGADVQIAPTVTSVIQLSTGTYRIGLSGPTVGFGDNSTLYFGDTYVWPLQDSQVESLSLQYTGSTSTWNIRKVDPIGAMGGSLVDGAVVSERSPIQSFVYDAFTQLNQGGVGVHITNNGYAQLVSVFTIFCSTAVRVDNGGIASITNSNCNFGDLGLYAKGYGTRSFSGTVYNPPNRAYPFSPVGTAGSAGLDPYYPSGYWPDRQGNIEIFVPDLNNRPHISLVMEVIPPQSYNNPLNSVQFSSLGLKFKGFTVAQSNTSTLVAGTINLKNIITKDVAIGHRVYIIDQFGYPYDNFQFLHDEFGNYLDSTGNITNDPARYVTNPAHGIWYASTGTVVSDLDFNTITLNQALTGGGSYTTDPNYFNIYFCGNNYYTVMTSKVADQPYVIGTNILSSNTNAFYQGPTVSQIAAHIGSLQHLNAVVDLIISNSPVTPTVGNTSTQYTNPVLSGGVASTAFINIEFVYLTSIIGAANLSAAESVVPANLITKTGPVARGAGSAISLIQGNIEFLKAEVIAYVNQNYNNVFNNSTMSDGQAVKCARDVELILQQLIYDLETGGNYNMVYSGLSYWSRPGTYHVVELGEAVTDPSLFPDGAIVNFYQRSYISASGYLFEYVGAGSNYGALPQNGIADPVQSQETIQLNYGKVFFTSTDQNGDFRIGPELVISQATGVISGRTFTQSLFANMTPFILAVEGL